LKPSTIESNRAKRLFGWIGLCSLLMVIPIKAIRLTNHSLINSIIVDVAPSAFVPAGLLFLVLWSSSVHLVKFTLLQKTLLVFVLAIGIEFIQLIPLPLILANFNHTFDWFDVTVTLVSISVAYCVARLLIYTIR
jgi:hypothetical protein